MKTGILEAFRAVCSGYPPDRIVVDPELNQRFISKCRELGLSASPAILNRSLLNLRKAGRLSGLKRATRTSFKEECEYRFAAEIAIRHLERRTGKTLDEILCEPELALEFDQIAQQIVPGYSVLQYRWAALNLRKAKRLAPELMSQLQPDAAVQLLPVTGLQIEQVPDAPGLYVFASREEVLYVGEAENLRRRLRKHLDHSDIKGLARWQWENGTQDMILEVHVLPDTLSQRQRRSLESELIESRGPVFNIRR